MPTNLRRFLTAIAVAGPLVLIVLLFPSANAADKSSGGKHCLWRITDAKAPVYILGSIHRLRGSDYPLAPVIEDVIKQSQQFYFEYDPKLDASLSAKLVKAAEYPRGVQIKGKIRPETYKYLMQITQTGAGTWQHLKPWAIAMFMLQHPAVIRVSSAYGIDNYVDQKARYHNKPRHGLESVDEHVNVFGGMSDAEGEVFLLESLVFGSMIEKQFPEMVSAWKSGDTQRIYAMDMQVSPKINDAPNLNARLLDYRNQKWVPKIEGAMHSGQPTLIVAGCMHFSGPGNVLQLLRARGHTIEQL